MKPRKEIVERAMKNGAMDRVNQLLSANQILMAASTSLVEEAQSLLEANGLFIGLLKQKSNNVVKAFDIYFTEFAQMVPKEMKLPMFRDIDDFNYAFRRWAKLLRPEEIKKPKPMRGITKAAKQSSARMSCKDCPIHKKYKVCPEDMLDACHKKCVKSFKNGVKFVTKKKKGENNVKENK